MAALEALRTQLSAPNVQLAQGAYFSFVVLGGLVLLPLCLVTFALSKNAARNSGIVNFLAGLSIFALGDALLYVVQPTRTRARLTRAALYPASWVTRSRRGISASRSWASSTAGSSCALPRCEAAARV